MNTASLAYINTPPSGSYLVASALQQRKRAPNLRAEATAICGLSKALAGDPSSAVRHVLDSARHLCGAGSAGLSLLRHDQAGLGIVRWEAIGGALATYEGVGTPRTESPCGLCLDAGITIVVSRPERTFERLHAIQPAITEDLIVPLYDGTGNALGTLWLAHHDNKAHFHFDDVRIVEQLAAQLVLALKLQEQASEYRNALAALESHHLAQRTLREQAELDHRQALVFKDAMIQEVNHRTKNTLQMAGSLLSLHARATSSAEVRDALLDSVGRLNLLAKVHELLYSNPDSAQSIVMPQLLQSMGDALRHSFGDAFVHVNLVTRSDPVMLPVQDAVSIALIVNEAVTNAYKHAFPNGSTGEITVSLSRAPGQAMILRIADTGIGLHATDRTDGMGVRLIRTLAAQLRGTLDIDGKDGAAGTQITLTMPPIADLARALEH